MVQIVQVGLIVFAAALEDEAGGFGIIHTIDAIFSWVFSLNKRIDDHAYYDRRICN